MGLKNSSKTQHEIIAKCTPGFAKNSIPSDLPIKYFNVFPIFATNCTTSEYSVFETHLFEKQKIKKTNCTIFPKV